MKWPINIETCQTIRCLFTAKNLNNAWFPFMDNNTNIFDVCNNYYRNSNKPTLFLFSNENLQISYANNSLKFHGENLIRIPSKIKYFKNRITYRDGNEAELIEVIENNIEKYKKQLNNIVSGLDEKVKDWDSERIQGMLFMCGYKFEQILDESTTDCAFVSFPECNTSFLFIPANKQLVYQYLFNEKLSINFLLTKWNNEVLNYLNIYTKMKINEMISFKNLLQDAKLIDNIPLIDKTLLWDSKYFSGLTE